jgi:murein L,D-transpeptidase YcbB/YkuD
MSKRGIGVGGRGLALTLGLSSAVALAAGQPQSILPDPVPTPTASPSAAPSPAPTIIPEDLLDEPVMSWSVADAGALLGVIEGIAADGLIPADYQPAELRAAIEAGSQAGLDAQASRSFTWLVEDLRDGRTRIDSRLQWFVVDTDLAANPTSALMTQALTLHDVPGVIAGLLPTAHDYGVLKAALATLPKADKARRSLIRVNMDRWRWLPRELGELHLMTNVPEFHLRVVKNNEVILTYRTVVGKPGKTATPQLAEKVEAVVFNPTWTVPQSIVMGEGLGPQLLANPRRAARENYKVTKGKDGYITVVQQPGDGNALGRMKIDMPNPHAIYLHDTPSKQYFSHPVRAYSHGCIRTERAVELGMALAIKGAGMTPEKAAETLLSKTYTRVLLETQFPIYIAYFTYGTNLDGEITKFPDIYERDAPVVASFAAPREAWYAKRKTAEKVIKLDNPI